MRDYFVVLHIWSILKECYLKMVGMTFIINKMPSARSSRENYNHLFKPIADFSLTSRPDEHILSTFSESALHLRFSPRLIGFQLSHLLFVLRKKSAYFQSLMSIMFDLNYSIPLNWHLAMMKYFQ